jgi:superfamily II DNA or RNA helicase
MADRGMETGIYEDLVTSDIEERLHQLLATDTPVTRRLMDSEAADRFALHVSEALRRAIEAQPDHGRAVESSRVVTALLRQLEVELHSYTAAPDLPAAEPVVLTGVVTRNPDGSTPEVQAPITPLLDTTILTNSKQDLNMSAHLKSEIRSASGIDAIIAFIRRPGVRPLLADVRRVIELGHRVRILTTSFTGFTEVEALTMLAEAGAEIRVSYDTSSSRLHAKAWIFHRPARASTALVGSSNVTSHALESGLEWNVRLSQRRNPDAVEKMMRVFDSYWESQEFVAFDAGQFRDRAINPLPQPGSEDFQLFDIAPHAFQERMLEEIRVARELGHHRNLLVAATGTGKTVMAALDYKDLRRRLPRARLLFVAHREEILDQSLRTFRMVLGDAAFGEKWVGTHRPKHFEHVFASIQSLSRNGLAALDPAHFDVVIVDEFHHAAATTYERLLTRVEPLELLGLTATPERADGLSVLDHFDGRIAAEMRLWDAIAEGRLAPFQYYAIHDGASLTQVPWKRGKGYDTQALTNVFTSDQAWARLVIRRTAEQADVTRMRAMGFCVSVGHARFMADQFNSAGIPSVAVWGDSPDDQRRQALSDLRASRVRAVFSVDLFNEGVDIPDLDTLLMLRPTESATLFLQQLGRGLRRTDDKAFCTVLDFVSQHNREFRFDQKMRALIGGGSRKDLVRNIEQGFPNLPPGASAAMDAVAQDIILASIRNSLPSTRKQFVTELTAMVAAGHEPTLPNLLAHTGVELGAVYSSGRCFSDLLEAAGLAVEPSGPDEKPLRKALGRLLHLDDLERIGLYQALVTGDPPTVGLLDQRSARLWRMLIAQITEQAVTKETTIQQASDRLWTHPQVRAELTQILEVLGGRIDHEHVPLPGGDPCPLLVHARYSRIEVQAALGDGAAARVPDWREGVRWLPEEQIDALLVTLNKADGTFSPTTAYRDYAMTRTLFHWESQSTTSSESPTGQRYQNHTRDGSRVMLFARMSQSDRDFWFLGTATYVSHEGTRPMGIVWRLDHPIPADLYADFAAVGVA